jgi:hypothetical protein
VPRPPDTLPHAGASAHEGPAATWIVAGEPGPALDALARAAGARPLAAGSGLATAPEPAAARLVAGLRARGILRYAEPDAPVRRAGLPAEPLSPAQWWIPELVPAELTPPAPAPSTGPPEIAIVEDGADTGHPDLAGHVAQIGAGPPHPHGTAVASVASGAANGVGVTGIYPGAATRVYASVSCADTAAAVIHAARDGARVINMSYGFAAGACHSHLVATQLAFGQGAVLVASAGNELAQGSPPTRPANDPHVVSVGAVGPGLAATDFSSRNGGLDMVAPGVGIPVALPLPDDDDGTIDGYGVTDGTSFAAPLVSGAAAWLRRARPELSAQQTSEVLRRSARDLGAPGWDGVFGWGLLDLGRALSLAPPAADPGEPNDDIEWVDGRRFIPDAPRLRVATRAAIRARLDRDKDPVDVVPVWLPPRSVLTVGLRPRGADVDVEVFDQRASTVGYQKRPASLVGRGVRRGLGAERVRVANPSGAPRRAWVAAYIADGRALAAGYTLRLKRAPMTAAATAPVVRSRFLSGLSR